MELWAEHAFVPGPSCTSSLTILRSFVMFMWFARDIRVVRAVRYWFAVHRVRNSKSVLVPRIQTCSYVHCRMKYECVSLPDSFDMTTLRPIA